MVFLSQKSGYLGARNWCWLRKGTKKLSGQRKYYISLSGWGSLKCTCIKSQWTMRYHFPHNRNGYNKKNNNKC